MKAGFLRIALCALTVTSSSYAAGGFGAEFLLGPYGSVTAERFKYSREEYAQEDRYRGWNDVLVQAGLSGSYSFAIDERWGIGPRVTGRAGQTNDQGRNVASLDLGVQGRYSFWETADYEPFLLLSTGASTARLTSNSTAPAAGWGWHGLFGAGLNLDPRDPFSWRVGAYFDWQRLTLGADNVVGSTTGIDEYRGTYSYDFNTLGLLLSAGGSF